MSRGGWKSWVVIVAVAGLAVLVYLGVSAVRTIRSTQTTAPGEAPAGERGASSAGRAATPRASFVDTEITPEEVASFGASVTSSRPLPAGLTSSAARDYRLRARFPESSHPIEGEDPIARERTPQPASQPGPGGAGPTLTVLLSQVSYEAPEPVFVYAYLSRDGQRVGAERVWAAFVHETAGEVARVELEDSGDAVDGEAGDRIYTALFQPPPDSARELKGSFLVAVRALTLEGEERAASNGFLYSVPDAVPTGRVREALVDGSLRLEAEVRVRRAGRFHLEGTLYGPQEEPLVWAQTATRLEPGLHWMALDFYGLALRERGVDGPYRLRWLALSTTTGMPNQKNRVLEDAYQTRAYRVEQFTDQPYGNPDLLEAAQRLEAQP